MGPNLSPIKYIYFEFRNYQNHQSLIVKKGDFKDVTCQDNLLKCVCVCLNVY